LKIYFDKEDIWDHYGNLIHIEESIRKEISDKKFKYLDFSKEFELCEKIEVIIFDWSLFDS